MKITNIAKFLFLITTFITYNVCRNEIASASMANGVDEIRTNYDPLSLLAFANMKKFSPEIRKEVLWQINKIDLILENANDISDSGNTSIHSTILSNAIKVVKNGEGHNLSQQDLEIINSLIEKNIFEGTANGLISGGLSAAERELLNVRSVVGDIFSFGPVQLVELLKISTRSDSPYFESATLMFPDPAISIIGGNN